MTEHQMQQAFFQWWAVFCKTVQLDKRLCYAVPNAGKRSVTAAAWMKSEGLRPGVPDISLDVARGAWHGLRIEAKRRPNKPSDEQLAMIAALTRQGYFAIVCYELDEMIEIVTSYLSGRL